MPWILINFGMFGTGEAVTAIVNESAATDRAVLIGIDSSEHTHSPSGGFYALDCGGCQGYLTSIVVG